MDPADASRGSVGATGAEHEKQKGGRVMAERDMELKVILDQLAAWRNKYGVRHITVSVEGSGLGHAHGWNGAEKIYISGQYGGFKKDETPGAATPEASGQ